MIDCHIHSNFSGDSKMNAVDACEIAIKLGLNGIAFTDHLDIDYPNYDAAFDIDFAKYSEYMDNLKIKYAGRLDILKGIEVGIQPHVIEPTKKIVETHSFDFVIGSVHVIDGFDPYYGIYYEGKSKKEAFDRYLNEIIFMVNNFSEFDVLGHIGYIRRYGNYEDSSLKYIDYSDLLDTILKKVIDMGKGIEVNTSSYKTKLLSPMPDFDIIKRYKDLGGEIICLGSDAHAQPNIGLNFEMVTNKLKEIGFKYLAHFKNRKPIFLEI